jgi:hypothetical protein
MVLASGLARSSTIGSHSRHGLFLLCICIFIISALFLMSHLVIVYAIMLVKICCSHQVCLS